jgi:hypothetical protein
MATPQACVQKDGEITVLNDELVNLRDVRQKQRDAISKQEFYEKYLKLVLEETDEFSEINELIDRSVPQILGSCLIAATSVK